ncbi:hypothetical protein BGX29_000833 [Mortierella sp. GBA35]|nr:hypothetical protein BGX29_000833 [Mortierella sp. GBA35]
MSSLSHLSELEPPFTRLQQLEVYADHATPNNQPLYTFSAELLQQRLTRDALSELALVIPIGHVEVLTTPLDLGPWAICDETFSATLESLSIVLQEKGKSLYVYNNISWTTDLPRLHSFAPKNNRHLESLKFGGYWVFGGPVVLEMTRTTKRLRHLYVAWGTLPGSANAATVVEC